MADNSTSITFGDEVLDGFETVLIVLLGNIY